MSGERGQATVEWVGVLLVVSLAFGALLAVAPLVDGRSLGGFLAHRISCAVRGQCQAGDSALARAYGARDAELVRAHAPNLVYELGERQIPVDWRRCRKSGCASVPDDRDLDVHRSDEGVPATAFTRVLRKGGRRYIQYWLYYPDSNTAVLGSDHAWERAWLIPTLGGLIARPPPYPGYHRDDWEGYVVRLDPDGDAWARASSHGAWQGCKQRRCRNEWTAKTGWTRVSRGSHGGHIPLPGPSPDERTSTSEGLRLIPLETLERRSYRRNGTGIAPPWRKDVYDDPEGDES